MALAANVIDRDAVRLDPPTLAHYLGESVGPELTAHMLDLSDDQLARLMAADTESVPEWGSLIDRRLRAAYAAVRVLVDEIGPKTAMTWLFGDNRFLSGAPIETIRKATTDEQLDEVLRAARDFTA